MLHLKDVSFEHAGPDSVSMLLKENLDQLEGLALHIFLIPLSHFKVAYLS